MRAVNKHIADFFSAQKQWVFGAQIFGALAAIALGKLIALYIAPEVFGQYSLIVGVEAFFTALLVHPANQSFQYALQTEEKSTVFSYYLKLFLWLGLLAFVFYAIISFTGIFEWWIITLLVAITLFSGYFKLISGYLNLEFRFKSYSLYQVLFYSLQILLFVVLIISLGERRIEWLLVVVASATFISFLVQITLLRKEIPFFSCEKIAAIKSRFLQNEMVSYAKPLVILAVFSWVSNYADKYLIDYFLDREQVGYYAAGYSLGTKFFLAFVSPFLILLRADLFKKKKEKQSPKTGLKKTVAYLIPFALMSMIVLIAFVLEYDFLGNLFLSVNYTPAFVIIPVIGGAFFLLTLSYFFEVSFYVWKTTRYILYANVIGAMTNIILNFFFIPFFGIIGAAYATLLGYGVQMLLVVGLYFRLLKKG